MRAPSNVQFLLILLLVGGCSVNQEAEVSALSSSPAPAPTFEADIRWTSHGIPHVKANDWASLGYGFAYATAVDAVCVIAKDVQMVTGNLSAYFGPEEGRLESDIFHRAILTDEKLKAFNAVQTEQANAFTRGYVHGYNRYLADNAETLPASCRGADWVVPIDADDITRLGLGVGIRYGLGRFQREIAGAGPKVSDLQASAETLWDMPEGIGSNAVAVGKDLSANGSGILLGNPHYPWHGSSRFHMIHLTIPGELDVMGSSLLTTSRVSIGFNKDIAWTHTVSTAMRFTLYQLTLNPDNPMEYLYDGAYRPIEARQVTVESGGESLSRTVYFTHYGPVLENEAAQWTNEHAYALRDAVIDNYLTADTYDTLSKATSTSDVEAAISKQGVYWVNTIAADRHGNAFYADISGTPNVDAELLTQCRVTVPGLPAQLVILDGSTSNCEWREDAASKVPGALAADSMPRLTRSDYVTNSNDSYWLSNPQAPLEGYSPIIGPERTARSLRTRAGLTQMAEMMASNNKLEPADLQDMLYNHRNFGAELLLDDVLTICKDESELAEACTILSAWDRTGLPDSVGSHVWREFWDTARKIENLYTIPFDVEDPVNTPRGINVADPAVAAGIRASMLEAVERLQTAGIALDAPLGEIQYAERNGRNIPVPGGEGWAGMFSMIVSKLQPERGYNPIVHGNSYIQVVSWSEDGAVQPSAMLAYSQSPEADSPYYSDLTEMYARGEWITLPFTDAEIEADPELRRLRLVE